jgi:hypothetical protein
MRMVAGLKQSLMPREPDAGDAGLSLRLLRRRATQHRQLRGEGIRAYLSYAIDE